MKADAEMIELAARACQVAREKLVRQAPWVLDDFGGCVSPGAVPGPASVAGVLSFGRACLGMA